MFQPKRPVLPSPATLGATLGAVLGLALPLGAQSLNVDFDATFGAPSNAYGAAAGQPGFWNGADPPSVTSIPLLDLTGAPTGASMAHPVAFGSFAVDNPNTAGDDQALMDDCQNLGTTPNSDVWTFSGLNNGTYDVYVYAWAPDNPRFYLTGVRVVGGSAGVQSVGLADWTGSHVEGETYARDRVTVTSGTLAVAAMTQISFGSLNGIQIVDLGSSSSSYCTAGTTSSGCLPALGDSGFPSLSNAVPYALTVSGAEGSKNGVFFYSIAGRNAAPWGNSTSLLCVKAPTQRMNPPLSTGGTNGLCDGSMSIDWNAYVAANPGKAINQALVAGSTVGAQAWMRDPPAGTGPVGSKGTNLSDALEFTVFP